MLYHFLFIAALVATSAFFSAAEISLAASRRLRLRQMADDGDTRAARVLRTQEQPGIISPWCKSARTPWLFWAVLWVKGPLAPT